MGLEKPEVHRAGALKQTNKAHKHGRHRSKGTINASSKGKMISAKTISKNNKRALNKDQRRNQATQIRQNKRDEVLSKKRAIGGLDNAPFLVCILPVRKEFHDRNTALNLLTQCDPEAVVRKSPTGVTHICIQRFKQRFAFITPPLDDDLAVLDALKICDSVLFLVSAISGRSSDDDFIDSWGENILLSAISQGLPTPIIALTDLDSIAPKKRHEHKQYVQKSIGKWFPSDEKVMTLGTDADGLTMLRKIGNQKRHKILYRDRRPHLFADAIDYIPDEIGTSGTLKVTGYLRGAALSVNGLVHIPGLGGDFQMLQIDAPFDPYNNNNATNKNNAPDGNDAAISIKILDRCDTCKQESLDSENVPDPMDAEQTWPTNDEIELARQQQQNKIKKIKKVPKGWSDYQAAWIPDDDAEFHAADNDVSDDDSNNDYMDAISEELSEQEEDELFDDAMTESELPTPSVTDGRNVDDDKYDKETDVVAERKELEKMKAAKEDRLFPDEVDTPLDQPARIRFQKYRGLESFRTSPWDPKENLPSDYSRIFQFENFDRTKRRVLKEQEENGVSVVGSYITVHIKDVSQLVWSTFQESSLQTPLLVLIGLFPHEHKMSVLNTILKRTPNYSLPLKSKERLIFQCGYRRFVVNPVFSQHTNGQKHKFERFFQPNSIAVATFYAPIQFPPAPILCYKEVNNELILVATGNLLSCNPDRIILKRIVLSGHPLKIYKRSAVIRFMFFNREDIIYFKPCKLRTKMGRIGHIKDSLGTHGHIKCVFDGQLKSEDTVLLNLYKRVYPKWTYEDFVANKNNSKIMDCI